MQSKPHSTGRGEVSSRESHGETPPGGMMQEVVSGEVRVRGAISTREARFAPEDMRQLAFELSALIRPQAPQHTFGDLAQAWLTRVHRVRPQDEARNLDVLKPLWHLREGELTPAAIDGWFCHLVATGYSPVSINHYRSAGRLVIRDAQANSMWGAANPFDLVRRLKQPKRKYDLLPMASIMRVLAKLAPEYERMARLTLALGLRPGEVFALRRSDIDFNAGVIHVWRSHGRDSTKSGRDRWLPILRCIERDITTALRESNSSELVFPASSGKQRRADSKMTEIFRNAAERAGIETTMRWYDLRHCAETLHRMAGADKTAVQIMMGHIGEDVDDEEYFHPDMQWLRRELMRFELPLSRRERK